MNQFQKGISFKSVDDFLEYLPDDERRMTEKLRKIILDCLPGGREKLAYNVPFYYQHKRICYIWPASVPWGKIKETGVVEFGFCQGVRMSDDMGILNKKDRKEIATIKFRSIKEIDADLLRSYIFEALFIDEQDAQKKRSRPLSRDPNNI